MEIEEHKIIWKSEDEDSMVSATVGRVMTTVLTARPTKLIDSISRLQSSPNPQNPLALSLENSLRILHKYVRDGAEKEESLDEILIPMIEHSLRSKDSKHKNQDMILLNWLFQDEVLFQALARKFSDILLRKEDHHIAFGWCILARRLIEYDVTMSRYSVSGIKERYTGLLENLCMCSGLLLSLINNGSSLQGAFELPTRLSVAAADCITALSLALTKKEMVSDASKDMKKLSKSSQQELGRQKNMKPISQTSEITRDMEMSLLLWNLVDHLIMLVQRLLAWSKKSRSLHAKGLERVLRWLQETKKQYHSSQDQAGQHMVKTGMLLLSSCWKHYGALLHLEDHQISSHYKELLNQYLSGIEYYAGNYKDHIDDNDSGISTINFFLNCLLLLLGRFTSKQFDTAMMEHRVDITRVVSSQLCSADDDVINGAVSILKATIFGTNHLQSGCTLTDNKQMKSVLPLLLNLLDERDGTARAVVTLIAEYCSMSEDGYCLEQILQCLASENINQRRNALDVVSEVINFSSDSPSILPHLVWQDMANHLLECLKDEEDIIRAHANKLLTLVDPSLVLPALVNLIYSSDSTLSSSATTTLLGVLTCHNRKPEVISMLLDCLSNLDASSDYQKPAENYRLGGSKVDVDKVLRLIPEWSRSVKNWKLLVRPLVDKMFAEPSNPIMVKFLSYISDYLGAAADIVFQQILLNTESQTEIDENLMSELDISHTENDIKLQHSLFNRLCPLLLIRLLPLKVFNDQKSSLVYGDLPGQNNNIHDINETRCIASLLLKRTFNKLEFEDVRKLSAELCGRLHPNVFFPAVSCELERATNDQDILKIKACLFAICTSLVVRGVESVCHPGMSRVRESIETVLLWPSIDGDEISKAQHGCIDCLAIALCTEFQAPKLIISPSKGKSIIQAGNSGTITFQAYMLKRLTFDEHNLISSNWDPLNQMSEKQLVSFRLCMANVLISACQKISDSAKRSFASKILQRIIHSINNVKEPEIRAAFIQVLFSVVYHLKSVVLPYSSDLLKASLESLKRGSEMERMGGAKLLASLMASEEVIVQSISEELLEAKTLLLGISQTDSSPSVRQLCSQLLACMTST